MSNILSLPLYRIAHSVQSNEDWNLPLAVMYSDDVTPIDLTGISFLATFGSYSVAGTITGPSNNILTFHAPASVVATWVQGVYPLTILATAADGTLDLVGWSTFTVGAPQITPLLIQLVRAGGVANTLISFVAPGQTPTGLLNILLSLGSTGLAPLAALITAAQSVQSKSTLLPLIDAELAALPHVANGDAVPATGLPYADADGFYADAQ